MAFLSLARKWKVDLNMCATDLRALRGGLSQKEMARRLGLSLRMYCYLESGEYTPEKSTKPLLWLLKRHPELLQELSEYT